MTTTVTTASGFVSCAFKEMANIWVFKMTDKTHYSTRNKNTPFILRKKKGLVFFFIFSLQSGDNSISPWTITVNFVTSTSRYNLSSVTQVTLFDVNWWSGPSGRHTALLLLFLCSFKNKHLCTLSHAIVIFIFKVNSNESFLSYVTLLVGVIRAGHWRPPQYFL